MANTVNTNAIQWDGVRGSLCYNLSCDGSGDLADTVLITLSTLSPAPASIKIRTIQCTVYGNFIMTLEFDATADIALITIENQTADVSYEFVRDFTDFPNAGWQASTTNKASAGFTGNLLLTTSGMQNLDGFDLVVTFEKD